jgi:hypothetical protein
MKKILLLGFAALGATAFAASNTFKVQVFQDSVVEGKTLKAGEYKLAIENGNAVISEGKESIHVPAREETEPNKISATELIYHDNTQLQEIRIGGTHTRIIFEGATPMNSGM